MINFKSAIDHINLTKMLSYKTLIEEDFNSNEATEEQMSFYQSKIRKKNITIFTKKFWIKKKCIYNSASGCVKVRIWSFFYIQKKILPILKLLLIRPPEVLNIKSKCINWKLLIIGNSEYQENESYKVPIFETFLFHTLWTKIIKSSFFTHIVLYEMQ